MSRETTFLYVVNSKVNDIARKEIIDMAFRIDALTDRKSDDPLKEHEMRELGDISTALRIWAEKIK